VPLYDCTFILNPQLEETALDGCIKNARDMIDHSGGRVVSENRMGMRRFAYEIQKLSQGYYISLVFEGGGRTVGELEHQLRLDEGCLRFLTCLAPKVTEREDKSLSRSQEANSTTVSGPHQHNKPSPKSEPPEEKDATK